MANLSTTSTSAEIRRPTWFPDHIDFDSLADGFKQITRETLVPLYDCLVGQEANPVKRAVGLNLFYLVFSELMEHYQNGLDWHGDRESREQSLNLILRICGRNERLLRLLMDIHEWQGEHEGFIHDPMRASSSYARPPVDGSHSAAPGYPFPPIHPPPHDTEFQNDQDH